MKKLLLTLFLTLSVLTVYGQKKGVYNFNHMILLYDFDDTLPILDEPHNSVFTITDKTMTITFKDKSKRTFRIVSDFRKIYISNLSNCITGIVKHNDMLHDCTICDNLVTITNKANRQNVTLTNRR